MPWARCTAAAAAVGLFVTNGSPLPDTHCDGCKAPLRPFAHQCDLCLSPSIAGARMSGSRHLARRGASVFGPDAALPALWIDMVTAFASSDIGRPLLGGSSEARG